MSKDNFPRDMDSQNVLHDMFEFIEDWKNRLYDMMCNNTLMMQVYILIFHCNESHLCVSQNNNTPFSSCGANLNIENKVYKRFF